MKTIFIALLFGFMLQSCSSTIPFTHSMVEKYKLDEGDLRSLQFYTSEELILTRGESEKSKSTEGGVLKIKDKDALDQVIIPAGTKCIVEGSEGQRTLKMRFGEEGDKTLVFGSIKKHNGVYSLMAKDWEYGRASVQYMDEEYKTQRGASSVFLTIEVKSLKETKSERTVEKGASIR